MARHQRGFTLIEILLVLVVLVVGAALVTPLFSEGSARAMLEDAAEKLSTLWGRARLDAMASGTPLVFQCDLGAGAGVVQSPFYHQDAQLDDAAPAMDPMTGEPTEGASVSDVDAKKIELADVVFRSLVVGEPAGSEFVGADRGEGTPSVAVVFRPDGVTSDAEVILEHKDGAQIKVTLRGLTGAARVTEVSQNAP